MMQKEVFQGIEGKAWLDRNLSGLGKYDPVSETLEEFGIVPERLLEIGCADGWRLRKIAKNYGSECAGIDAITGHTADNIPYDNASFDVVVMGFCLYVCDPEDYFRIVAESDRVLGDDGYLLIHDFNHNGPPLRCRYSHSDMVYTHKLEWPKLWLSHPHYKKLGSHVGQRYDVVTVLRKSAFSAFMEEKGQ